MSAGEGLPPDCCHPAKSIRTKCVCGNVLTLSGAYGSMVAVCKCGRTHKKASLPGGAFAAATMIINCRPSTGQRRGGSEGCPGVGFSKKSRAASTRSHHG